MLAALALLHGEGLSAVGTDAVAARSDDLLGHPTPTWGSCPAHLGEVLRYGRPRPGGMNRTVALLSTAITAD